MKNILTKALNEYTKAYPWETSRHCFVTSDGCEDEKFGENKSDFCEGKPNKNRMAVVDSYSNQQYSTKSWHRGIFTETSNNMDFIPSQTNFARTSIQCYVLQSFSKNLYFLAKVYIKIDKFNRNGGKWTDMFLTLWYSFFSFVSVTFLPVELLLPQQKHSAWNKWNVLENKHAFHFVRSVVWIYSHARKLGSL